MNYKEIKDCIYIIECNINKKKYVGYTRDLGKRIIGHHKDLNSNKHNKGILEDFKKYGIDNFNVIIKETIFSHKELSKDKIEKYLHYREAHYMDYYNTQVCGYNINKAIIKKEDLDKGITHKEMNLTIGFKELSEFFINDRDEINALCKLYFEYNPHYNKGVAFKAKTNDIISAYRNKHGKNYEEIKECIEKSPMCQDPIWTQFFNFFFKNNNKKKEEKSEYKDSISDSTDPNDWL